ncbi:MAG: hypothetical protein M1820_002002 [Bogoriella megaspora]|nr:MAG: hypothetical protein M1820_002002 [Bogoriella megaspora]
MRIDVCGVRAAIVGERLWFTGGTFTFDNGVANSYQSNIFSVNLTSNVPAHSYINNDLYDTIPLPSGAPSDDSAGNSIMFYSNTSLYMLYPGLSNPLDMWIYNVSTNNWVQSAAQDSLGSAVWQYAGSNRNQWVSIPSIAQSWYAGTTNKGFAKRDDIAKRDEGTTPFIQSLDQAGGLAWHGNKDDKTPLLDTATLSYVRAGEQGVLIAFGGTDPSSHTQFAQDNLNDYREMSDIFIFDIASETWYNVTAIPANDDDTNYPTSRVGHCAGVSTSPDSKTFQITIYGGFNLFLQQPFNDVYTLDIPSFTWTNVTPSNQDLGDGLHDGRAWHQCHMGNDAQMLILGGQTECMYCDEKSWESGCDEQHPPFLVFDTNNGQWADHFDPSASYTVPSSIAKISDSEPSGGWPDGLSSVFAQRVASTPMPSIQPTARPDSLNTPSPTPGASGDADPDNSSKSHAGAIAGGVVGGIGGLAAICGIVYFFLRRRQQYKVVAAEGPYTDQDQKNQYPAPPQEVDGTQIIPEADAGQYIREAPGDIPLQDQRRPDGTFYKPTNAARNSGVYELGE